MLNLLKDLTADQLRDLVSWLWANNLRSEIRTIARWRIKRGLPCEYCKAGHARCETLDACNAISFND